MDGRRPAQAGHRTRRTGRLVRRTHGRSRSRPSDLAVLVGVAGRQWSTLVDIRRPGDALTPWRRPDLGARSTVAGVLLPGWPALLVPVLIGSVTCAWTGRRRSSVANVGQRLTAWRRPMTARGRPGRTIALQSRRALSAGVGRCRLTCATCRPVPRSPGPCRPTSLYHMAVQASGTKLARHTDQSMGGIDKLN
jgi:hypothetical protein